MEQGDQRSYFLRSYRMQERVMWVLVLVLGTGGILLMAAYAAVCERI